MKWVVNKLFVFVIALFTITNVFGAKPKCRIDFQIKNLENKKITLACQYGAKQLEVGTIALDSAGAGFYESTQRLTGGIYVVVLPSGSYFELLINDEQFFTVIADTVDIMNSLSIEGSEETDRYRQYQLLTAKYEEIKTRHKESHIAANAIEINQISQSIDSLKSVCYAENPESFVSVYFRMLHEPDMPDSALLKIEGSGKEQFLKRYQYRKENYFLNINFADGRQLRTRLLHEKLSYFFNVLLPQNSDSICPEIDRLLLANEKNDEAFKYLLNFFHTNYRTLNKPYYEKIYVHLADKYYLAGKTPWADQRFLNLLKQRTDDLRPALSGVKAANINLYKPSGRAFELHSIKANYLAVYFWSADCGNCAAESEKLLKVYKNYKSKGFKVLAIYVNADRDTWQNLIDANGFKWINAYDPLLKSNFSKLYGVNTTPKLYLLDSEKYIIEKNTTAEFIESYLKEKTDKN